VPGRRNQAETCAAVIAPCHRSAEPGLGEGTERPRLPGWLVVGAVSRNAGKTAFACAVINAFHRVWPIVGVKVTAIPDGESSCPRGTAGCGVCTSLVGDFQIDEETGAHPGKDTARMLESGAGQVFWVRCRRSRIHAALQALAPRLGPGTLVVAESNSLARAIEPDLFLMVKDARHGAVKPTAAGVMSLAHRVVVSADGEFDLQPRHLTVVGGAWHLAEASAAILAGGRSSRMGRDKSLLPVGARPLISRIHEQLVGRFDDILIGSNDPDRHAFVGARIVPDVVPGTGPLMGIASVVAAARYDRVFVTACDIPVVDLDTVGQMLVLAEDADCVVPVSAAGHEPLFAVYRRSALPAMREVLAAGRRRISAIFPLVRTHDYPLAHAAWYRNLNTPEEMTAFLDEAS
jgi:molybdopterin-guanine dinucleotide biosynthesis protein A